VVLKSEMKICQKYSKNIKVKHKTERSRGKEKEGVMPGRKDI